MWKFLFAGAFVVAVVIGTLNLGRVNQAEAQVAVDPGWRFTGGYWNYWDPGDRAWYHTDGRHWYTYNNNAWGIYNFDRNFGRSAFVRDGYAVPAAGVQIAVPRHPVFVP